MSKYSSSSTLIELRPIHGTDAFLQRDRVTGTAPSGRAPQPVRAALDVGEVVLHRLEVPERARRGLDQRSALCVAAEIRVIDTCQCRLTGAQRQVRTRKPLAETLRAGDHGQVDGAAALETHSLEERRHLGSDCVAPVPEIGERHPRRVELQLPAGNRLLEATSPEMVPETAQRGEPLPVGGLLRLELVRDDSRLVQLAVHVVQSIALAALEVQELLLALAILLLARELRCELLEPA